MTRMNQRRSSGHRVHQIRNSSRSCRVIGKATSIASRSRRNGTGEFRPNPSGAKAGPAEKTKINEKKQETDSGCTCDSRVKQGEKMNREMVGLVEREAARWP